MQKVAGRREIAKVLLASQKLAFVFPEDQFHYVFGLRELPPGISSPKFILLK